MIKLIAILREADGKRLNYNYEVQGRAKRFFNATDRLFVEYDRDVSQVPDEIAVIPFLANVLPIAWFAGFDVEVECCDSDFAESIARVEAEFKRLHGYAPSHPSRLLIHRQTTVSSPAAGRRSAMLFSGGVDAFATYFRHREEELDLCTIFGADIDLADSKQISILRKLNDDDALISGREHIYVWSNLRTFYTHHVDLLLEHPGWWGSVQHGLALLCVLAPVSFSRGHGTLYIAASFCEEMGFLLWGSMPETDNKVRWSGTQAAHDGYELSRQDKVELIVSNMEAAGHFARLRVCYSELNSSLNCSKCEKCLRTMFGLLIAGADPQRYGFNVGADVFDVIAAVPANGLKGPVARMFWLDLARKFRRRVSSGTQYGEHRQRRMQEIVTSIEQGAAANQMKTSPSLKSRVLRRFPRMTKRLVGARRMVKGFFS